jgi:hypothetical protein
MTSKTDITQNNDFRINNISNYLIDYKGLLKTLHLLDKNEVNKNLTNSLNNLLLPQLTFEEKYKFIISKMNEVETNIIEIKKQIEEFNNKQEYVSFIDIDNIYYITYFNEITFVDNNIKRVINYIDKDINLNYVYCYVINDFYDELSNNDKNYFFILEHRMKELLDKKDKSIIDEKILDFFSTNKILILKDIINLIFNSDLIFKEMIKKYEDDKFDFLKQIYNNKKILDDTKETLDFKPYMTIKNKFLEDKKKFFTISRDIVLEPKFQNIYEKLFSRQNIITIEIWFGFVLFIIKHFNVSIDKLIEFFNKKIPKPYLIQKDAFGDVMTHMAKYYYKKLSGGKTSFYKKYLKYKNKYLLAKKNIQKGGIVTFFQIYIFTKSPILPINKQKLLCVLQELYGQNIIEINDFSDYLQEIYLNEIKEFVHDKSRHYPSLTNITVFSITNIPPRLNECLMTDAKLINEENAIRDLLKIRKAPFKLVDPQHGKWDEGIALIALESL